MAIVKIDPPTASTPSYNPSISVDYNAQNDNLFTGIKGYNAVSLTNFDTTNSGPTVKAGSVLEANGVLYNFTTDESPSFSLSWFGDAYLVFNDSSLQLEMAQDTPAWSAAKNGYYVGTKRFTGYLADYDNIGMQYAGKRKYVMNGDGSAFSILNADGFISVFAGIYSPTYSLTKQADSITRVFSIASAYILPRGIYMFSVDISNAISGGPNADIEYNIDGAGWTKIGETRQATPFYMISDGSSLRINVSTAGNQCWLFW